MRPFPLRLEPLGDRVLPRFGLFAVGSDLGGPPVVRVYDTAGRLQFERAAFEAGFTGGVRSALAEVNGDGTPDVVAAAGPGGGPRVRVYDGRTDRLLADFFAYEDTFRGGVNVAAGDFDGDGRADVAVGAGVGGGPRVRVLAADGRPLLDTFVYADTLRDGVHVAAADLDGDGRAELVTGAARGGGPHVRYLRGDGTPIRDFFAYDPSQRGGLHVAAGDLDGDGRDEVVTGPGGAADPVVRVWDAAGGRVRELALDPTGNALGVPVAVSTPEANGAGVIVAGYGPGGLPRALGYRLDGERPFTVETAFPAGHKDGLVFGSGADQEVAYSEVLDTYIRLLEAIRQRELDARQRELEEQTENYREFQRLIEDDPDEIDELGGFSLSDGVLGAFIDSLF